MSVLCENLHGWVVDHQAAVAKVYEKTHCYYRQTNHSERAVSLQYNNNTYLKWQHLEIPDTMHHSYSPSTTEIKNLKQTKTVNYVLCNRHEDKEPDEVNEVRDLHVHSLSLPSVITPVDEIIATVCPIVSDHLQTESHKIKLETRSFKLRSDLFAVLQPFLMDSQFNKIQQEIAANLNSLPTKRKRKRKSDHHKIGYGEENKIICCKLKSSLNSLIKVAKCQGYFVELGGVPPDNNVSARSAAQIRLHDSELADLCEEWKSSTCRRKPLVIEGLGCYSGSDIVNRRVENVTDECVVTRVMDKPYLVPASCIFMMSSIEYLLHNSHQLTVDAGYDLIVIDPPWQNKSVKRKKSYYSLSEEEISMLPIRELAAEGCLVAMWCTNKPRVLHFVTQLMSSWQVQQSVTWYWLKVTTSGKPVSDIDSLQKQPFEMLLMARMKFESEDVLYLDLPADKTIISVPCSLHSKKPPLLELLLPYLPNKPRCLELFARNLWPGWTSWGNEVLRHQHIDFYAEHTQDVKRPVCTDVKESVVK